MTIKSMTGFARTDAAIAGFSWHWEVRSVNGRGLDIRLRLPPGNDALDQPVRQTVAAHITRGSVNVQLSLQRTTAGAEFTLNEAALAEVLAASEKIRALTGGPPLSTDAVLQVKGVLEITEPQEDEEEAGKRRELLLANLAEALGQLVASRQAEGAKLAVVLVSILDGIATTVERIEASPARTPDAIARRLKDLIARLSDSTVNLDPERLHQEAVLVAGKADIAEELQRLRSHLETAREYLSSSEPAGRKLDFLTQEFNREANTICSKSNDIEVTRLGLALKASVEQLREQVQNIE